MPGYCGTAGSPGRRLCAAGLRTRRAKVRSRVWRGGYGDPPRNGFNERDFLRFHLLWHGWPARPRLPARLEDLVPEFMPAVPVDPFDGKPMKMAAMPGGGIGIYSVGADFKDDGGKAWDDENRTGDITFHLGAK